MKNQTEMFHELFRLANDPTTDLKTLAHLSKNESEVIRGAVGSNISTDADVIELLKSDKSDHVMECLKNRAINLKLSTQPALSSSKLIH